MITWDPSTGWTAHNEWEHRKAGPSSPMISMDEVPLTVVFYFFKPPTEAKTDGQMLLLLMLLISLQDYLLSETAKTSTFIVSNNYQFFPHFVCISYNFLAGYDLLVSNAYCSHLFWDYYLAKASTIEFSCVVLISTVSRPQLLLETSGLSYFLKWPLNPNFWYCPAVI